MVDARRFWDSFNFWSTKDWVCSSLKSLLNVFVESKESFLTRGKNSDLNTSLRNPVHVKHLDEVAGLDAPDEKSLNIWNSNIGGQVREQLVEGGEDQLGLWDPHVDHLRSDHLNQLHHYPLARQESFFFS